MRPISIYTALSLAIFSFKSYSQETVESQEAWDIKLGAFTMSKSLPWKGANNQAMLLPGFDSQKGNWQFNIDTLVKYHFWVSPNIQAYMALTSRNDGYDSDEFTLTNLDSHKVFEGYEKPKDEVVAIAGGRYRYFSLSTNSDISNHSNGSQFKASFDYPVIQWQKGFRLRVGSALDWQDANYVNYYYGVSKDQENNLVGRSFYHTGSALNYQFLVKANLKINRSWMIMFNLKHTRLDKNIQDSPLISAKYQQDASVILMYQFQ